MYIRGAFSLSYVGCAMLLVLQAGQVAAQTDSVRSSLEIDMQTRVPDEEMVTIGQNRSVDMTITDIETQRLFGIAGAGEDPLQAVFSLPGVTFSDDGEPVIRGSAPGDNAYYVDFVPASKIYHIFGNSIFNKYVIQDFDLYPAAFSSQYGNATGGVIDVTLRDPANQPVNTTASISFLQAAVLVESGITDNQAFYFSARQSLIDKFLNEDDLSDEDDGLVVTDTPIATDYQAKYLWTPNAQNSLTIVAAGASDEAAGELTDQNNNVQVDPDFAGPLDYEERFDSQGLVWQWQSQDQSKQLDTLITNINETEDLFYGAGQFFKKDEQRSALRLDYGQSLGDLSQFRLGVLAESAQYDIDANLKFVNCSDFDPDCPTVDVEITPYKTRLEANSVTAYIENELQLGDQHRFTLGLHYSADDYLDESRIEPRARWDYQISESWSTYVAMGRYSQLPDLEFILEEVGNPELDTVKADHYVWGIANQITSDWSWTIDLYYKEINDLVISIDDPDAPDFDLNYTNEAEGMAYGVEFLINKDLSSKLDGWLAVSLGKTERKDLRNDETIPFDYDRPVMVDLVLNYHVSDYWTLGWKWSYQTGDRYTPIVDVAVNTNDSDILEPIYGERNSQVAPAYHRLDFRAEYKKPASWGHWSLYADVINVYGRENVSGYEFSPNGVDLLDNPPAGFGDNVPVRTEVSPGAIPSLGFEINF